MLKNKLFFVLVVALLTSSVVAAFQSAKAKQIEWKWAKPMQDGKEVVPPACPDSSIPGCNPPLNTGEAEQYKAGPLRIGGVLLGDSAAFFDGSVGAGTAEALGKLTVAGGNIVLKKPNVSHAPGYEMVWHSWSPAMATEHRNVNDNLGLKDWQKAKDECRGFNKDKKFVCEAPVDADGYVCTDVYKEIDESGDTAYAAATAQCLGNTSKYSLRAKAGDLEFLNNADAAKLTLTQNGDIKVEGSLTAVGSLTAQKICLAGDCQTAWPKVVSTGGEQVVFTESDAVIGNEILDAANSTLLRIGDGTAGSPYKLSLNLGNANVWSANQTFDKNIVVNGNVGIGTADPKAKLDVDGGNIVLGGNLGVRGNIDVDGLMNLGKRITFDEVNSSIVLRPKDVGENIYEPSEPKFMGSNKPDANSDTCDKNVDNFFWCDGVSAKPSCVDYGRIGGSPYYYQRNVACFTQANYTVKNANNSLLFVNGKGETKFVIGQDGNITASGNISGKNFEAENLKVTGKIYGGVGVTGNMTVSGDMTVDGKIRSIQGVMLYKTEKNCGGGGSVTLSPTCPTDSCWQGDHIYYFRCSYDPIERGGRQCDLDKPRTCDNEKLGRLIAP